MWKALAIKELRELAPIALLALVAYGLLLDSQREPSVAPWTKQFFGRSYELPFLGQDFYFRFILVSAPFAMALGLRQTLWESSQRTYQFLLHRPLGRDAILRTKLGTGMALYLVCAAAPILFLGLWAATPGSHPAPFRWSMTLDAVQVAAGFVLLYLGAFRTGLTHGRWFGTRAFPLLAAVLLFVVFGMLQLGGTYWYMPSVLVRLLVLAGLAALLVSNICFVARTRDFS